MTNNTFLVVFGLVIEVIQYNTNIEIMIINVFLVRLGLMIETL